MARPMQMVAVGAVYVLGQIRALASDTSLNIPSFFFGLLALGAVSLSIHYANEYADFETDSRTIRTPFSGGSGALPKSGLPRQIALWAAWVVLAAGVAFASWGFELGHLSGAAIAILAIGGFLGWMYSLKPLALAWRGLGELDNALLGGVLLPAYGFVVQTRSLDWVTVAGWLPFGALVYLTLLATTWADRKADAYVGKRTLATLWPVRRLRMMYLLAVVLAFCLLLLLAGWSLPPLVVWSSFLVLPISVWGAWSYTRAHSPFPSVVAMGGYLVIQLLVWWSVSRASALLVH